MSMGSKASPEYKESKATVKFDPLKFQENADYKNVLGEIGKLISSNPTQPIFDMGKNYATNVMSDKYQAYSPEQQQQMIDYQNKKSIESFRPIESNLSSRMANQGLAGSGASGIEWSGLGKKEQQILNDNIYNIGAENRAVTQQNKAQAFNSLPGLAGMSQIPLQNKMQYGGILGQDQSNQNAFNQWNSTMGQQAQTINAGAYQDWLKQKSQEANNNQNALGKAVGGLFGK